jgi:hypothetical protein
MKLQVTESQLKLIEQQQLNELKWLANVQSHIVKMDIPLTPSLVNYIWGKQRVTTFHIGDVLGIDRIGSMVGKRKSLSTFRFMEKTMLSKMKGIQTEGGIIYQIEGDLQFDAPRDIMSSPDETGRRWINIFSFPDNFRNRLEHEYEVHEKFRHINEPSGPSKDLIEYYRLIDRLVKEYAKEIREHFTHIKKNRESSWNETVVNNIEIKDILWKEDIIEFLDTWETKEQRIKVLEEIGAKLNSISTGTVYLADNNGIFGFRDINPVKWVEKRGGLSNFKKYVKKFSVNSEPRTIQINEDKPNPNNPPHIKYGQGYVLITPDKPVDKTACVIFGGWNSINGNYKELVKFIPENLQYKKTILITIPGASMGDLKRMLGNTKIKSIIGFEEGGTNACKHAGEYDIVGLINPVLDKDSHRYHINDNRVFMLYDPNKGILNGNKIERGDKLQKEFASIMMGNAIPLKDYKSENMLTYFLNRFQNNI